MIAKNDNVCASCEFFIFANCAKCIQNDDPRLIFCLNSEILFVFCFDKCEQFDNDFLFCKKCFEFITKLKISKFDFAN